MNINYIQTSVIALAMAMSGLSYAGGTTAGGYIGAGVGQSYIDVCDDLEDLGINNCDDEDTGFKIFGGYDFNENFAIEGSYIDYGEISASAGGVRATVESSAFTLTGKGSIPLNESFAVFAKGGVAFWDAEVDVNGFASDDEDGTDFIFGLGAEYSFSHAFGLRGEWERVDFDGDDVDLLSISGVFKF